MEQRSEPLAEWVCDVCGEIIHGPDEGYLEWLMPRPSHEGVEHGFRIVHHRVNSPRLPNGDCYYDGQDESNRGFMVLNVHLPDCVGPDGLVMLLTWMDHKAAVASDELAEIIRRLHIPHYEEARMYFERAAADGRLDGTDGPSRYGQRTLLEIIETYGEPEPS